MFALPGSRIENYPGFPDGISGAELAESTYQQAIRLGAENLVGAELQHVTTRSGRFRPGQPDLRSQQQALGTAVAGVELTNGAAMRTRAAVVATGVHYRRLDAEDVERLIGAGVFYGASPSEAPLYRDGERYGYVPGILRVGLVDLAVGRHVGALYDRLHLRKSSPLTRLQREMVAVVVNGHVSGAP